MKYFTSLGAVPQSNSAFHYLHEKYVSKTAQFMCYN
jgi:hypothetical protein